jgi:hypothetical protein
MEPRPRERVIERHAPCRSFARGSLGALERLGYRVLPPRAIRAAREAAGGPIEAHLVGPRELRALPESATAPVILLAGRCGPRRRPLDPRVVATIRRPAPLVELYRALQFALEPNPRRVPRAPITLPARCASGEADFPGAIVSLSEGGCLVRTARPPASRRRVRLFFPLPETGLVEVAARPLYHDRGHLGLAFLELADATRRAIAACVEGTLLAE